MDRLVRWPQRRRITVAPAALEHEATKDTKDTKKSVMVGGAPPNHLLFFVSFVLFVSFV